jgi:hypothetical protein
MRGLFDDFDDNRQKPGLEPPFLGVSEKQKSPYLYRETLPPILGTIDHTYRCTRPSCGAECNDILEEVGKEWLIMCAFCGLVTKVPSIRGFLQPKPAEFRFHDGLFEGMTPAEAAVEPRGAEYLSWAAANDPRAPVRQAVKTYLDAFGVGR